MGSIVRQVRRKAILKTKEFWSGRGDSNARPPAPKAGENAVFIEFFNHLVRNCCPKSYPLH